MSYAVPANRQEAAPVRGARQAVTPAHGLRIARPDDAFEREADRAAEAAITGDALRSQWSFSRMSVEPSIQRKCDCGGSGECEDCKSEKTLQRKARGSSQAGEVPAIVHDVLRSPGRPLDAASRAFFEPRFGHDFSRVRIHADEQAARSAQAIDAFAYTAGNNVVFGTGQYAPGQAAGRRLLGHELAHVVQQGGAHSAPAASLLPAGSRAEQEAGAAGRLSANGHAASIGQRVSPSQIARADKKEGEAAPSPKGSPAPVPTPAPAPATGTPGAKQERLRFDILGADTDVADLFAKQAGISRDPDLKVRSLEDMIDQLEAKAPANSNRCIEHISIFNHANVYGQPVAGGGKKKVPDSPEGGLPRSGFYLSWLYNAINRRDLARLRGVFCCDAEMYWLGCNTAGVLARGGKRSAEEVAASEHRFGEEFYRDEYRSEKEARAHGADTQHGAIFGTTNIQAWADATCTSIRGSNDFVYANDDPAQPLKPIDVKVGGEVYRGEFIDIKPSDQGRCSCDSASGRVHGTWDPAAGVDQGSSQWQDHLKKFNKELRPDTGSPDSNKIRLALLALLDDISSQLAMPNNLPHGAKVEPLGVAPSVFAYTYPHLVICYPDNCWKWIGVSPDIIQTTPAYTKAIIDHELQHALDQSAAAFEYKMINGPPPKAPAGACEQTYRPDPKDPYGQYILDFYKYYDTGRSEKRHLEISASTAALSFARFTPTEKVAWFASMLTTVPGDVSWNEELPSEPLVESVFNNPVPAEQEMRNRFAETLLNITREFLGTYGTSPTAQSHPPVKKDPLKAKTLINHFLFAWNPGDHRQIVTFVNEEVGKTKAAAAPPPSPAPPAPPSKGSTP